MPFAARQRSIHYDVFNGDADGICALHQLRLARAIPDAVLVTGVKRDIKLLQRIETVTNSSITVLDISFDANRDALVNLLAGNNTIFYADHHFAGTIPEADGLTTRIDEAPDQCTALIINGLLDDRFHRWALCGAYGDNLHSVAARLGAAYGLTEEQLAILREIGELLNYNGYGSDLQDLYFPPEKLYRAVSDYHDPFDFFNTSPVIKTLQTGFGNDMAHAQAQPEYASNGRNHVYRLPDSPWARRVSGVFANLKARENPAGAHALITENRDGTLRISVRAPLADRRDADTLCRKFPGGGGRAAAAGINALPEDQLDDFVHLFNQTYC